MDLDVYKDSAQFETLLDMAFTHLKTIRKHPSPDPAPGSAANLAFDPFIGRRLNTFVPIRVLEIPSHEATWVAIATLLDGWRELRQLTLTTDLTTWQVRLYSSPDLYLLLKQL